MLLFVLFKIAANLYTRTSLALTASFRSLPALYAGHNLGLTTEVLGWLLNEYTESSDSICGC